MNPTENQDQEEGSRPAFYVAVAFLVLAAVAIISSTLKNHRPAQKMAGEETSASR
jgi:hypothetical protein